MFLINWAQRSCIIYAVIVMMNLLPSAQLLELPKHSLARRHLGNAPEQTCDKLFMLRTSLGSRCQTSKGEIYYCDSGDCPGPGHPAFHFVDCLPLDKSTHLPDHSKQPVIVYPTEYTTVDGHNFIQAVDSQRNFYGCPNNENTQFLKCNYCAKH